MEYYKPYDDNFYSFEEAYSIVNKLNGTGKHPALSVEDGKRLPFRITYKDIPFADIGNIRLPLWASKSSKWQVLIPDDSLNEKNDEIRWFMEDDLKFELDTRFYNPDKMKISDWFRELYNSNYFTEDIMYNIIMWLKETNQLKKK